MIERFDKK